MTTIRVQVPAGLSEDAVRGLLEGITTRAQVLSHVTDAVANQPMPVGAASAAQIARVDHAWREAQARYGALDAGQYAQLVGAKASSRSVATRARGKGLLGYRRGRRILYPGFQFDEHGLRDGWADLVEALRAAGWADEDIVLWLVAPHGALDRRSPIESLDAGDRADVLAVVEDVAAGIW